MQVALTPFPEEYAPLLWEWMNECPLNNLDDSGPKNASELARLLVERGRSGTEYYLVLSYDIPVGAIGFLKVGDLGTFRGICFTRSVHGTGIPFEGVRQVIEPYFQAGAVSVSARYYCHNIAIRRFLEKFGAKHGFASSTEPVFQRGVRVYISRSVIYRGDFIRAMRRRDNLASDPDASARLSAPAR